MSEKSVPSPVYAKPSRASGCIIGVMLGSVLTLGGLIGISLIFSAFGNLTTPGLASGPKIAHIDLEGMITSSANFGFGGSGESMVDRMKASLKKAVEDDDVKAIVLRINSPGGEVTASDTIYHAVKQANDEKPVIVFMDATAASGGYYVACGAREIMANETTLTGSIGVIIQTLNYHELFGKVGLESLVFKSGKYKDILSSSRKMTEEEEGLVQDMVMEIYDKFLSVVAESRAMTKEELRNGMADGRVLSGEAARDAGLIDDTGYIEDAYERAREIAGEPDAEVEKVRSTVSFFEAFGLVEGRRGSAANRVEIDVSERLLPPLQPGAVYLLPSSFGR